VELRQGLALVDFTPRRIIEHTGSDVRGRAAAGLVGKSSVGNLRARHTDQITLPLGDGTLRQCRVANSAKCHHGCTLGSGSHLLVDGQEMAGLEVHVGDVIFQAQAEIALSVGEIVDASKRCQMAGDTRRLIGVYTAVD